MITSNQRIIKKLFLLFVLYTGFFAQAQNENTIVNIEESTIDAILNDSEVYGQQQKSLTSNLPVSTIQRHIVINPTSSNTATTASCKEIELSISFDAYPEDISWSIVDNNNNLVAKADRYNSFPGQKILAMKQCLPPGTYSFIIKDKNEDGLCCRGNRGFYHLYVTNGTSVASGASFGSRETTIFTINDANSDNEVTIDKVVTTEQIEYSLFPNPIRSGDLLQVDAPGKDVSYTIYNRLGKVTKKGQLQQNAINVDALETGRYHVEINIDDRPIVMDFVKQ